MCLFPLEIDIQFPRKFEGIQSIPLSYFYSKMIILIFQLLNKLSQENCFFTTQQSCFIMQIIWFLILLRKCFAEILG